MRLNKAIKKIVALGTGATMVGATFLGAMAAADLADYPSPFIKDGKFSGVLVVGDKAAAEDIIGVTDILGSLQFSATKKVGVSTTAGVSVEGDAWKVGTSSKKLEMGEYLDTGINYETFKNITKFIDGTNLKSLKSGEIVTNKGTAKYNQYLRFDAQNSEYVIFTENDDDVTADFVYIASGTTVARYDLEFTSSFDTDVEDSTGSSSTTGLFLGDYEDENIKILTTDYSVVKARRTSLANDDSVELTLMGGAVKDVLSEGETKTYNIKGKDYEVTVTAITDVSPIVAKFSINGESTTSLSDGSTDKLSDGTEIGVSDIIPNEAGDVTLDLVEFFLGANKVFLKDTEIEDDGTSSDALEVGSEKIDDANVIIVGTNDNSTVKINNVYINVTAEDDFFVPVGGKMSSLMDEPQALVGGWDIEYKGLDPSVATETIKIDTSGSDKYNLQFIDGDGNKVKLPIAYSPTGSQVSMGDNDDDLINSENQTIIKGDYFVVSDTSQGLGDRLTYALRYRGSDRSTESNPQIKFDNLGTGERIERPYKEAVGVTADASLQLGGATYGILNVTAATANDYQIKIDLNGDGTFMNESNTGTQPDATIPINITTKGGAQIQLRNVSGGTTHIEVKIETVDTDDWETLQPTGIWFNLTAASQKVALSDIGNLNYRSPDGETNTNYAYTSYGAKIKWENPTNDPDIITIDYPVKSQRLPQVYVTAGVTTTSVGTGEAVESVTIQKIEVGATKLASEVSDLSAQNTLLVGGPCANALTADAMGNPADCAAGFEAGKGMVQLFEQTTGNVALVIAGYGAADTRAAAAVLANYGDYKAELKGQKVEVTTATSTVKSVEVVAAAAPAAAETTTTV